MKKTLLKTADGSLTFHLPEWNEQYHSTHGALTEARHVFIQNGLHYAVHHLQKTKISLLEIGFGTGLNVILTKMEAEKNNLEVDYVGIEAFPPEISEIEKLNYPDLISAEPEKFLRFHQISWKEKHQISPNFSLTKRNEKFQEIDFQNAFDLIYFDAFGIRVQPELWTEAVFQRMFSALKSSGFLVTYAANGNARRALTAVGFEVERLPGPPGKKQMMRALKP